MHEGDSSEPGGQESSRLAQDTSLSTRGGREARGAHRDIAGDSLSQQKAGDTLYSPLYIYGGFSRTQQVKQFPAQRSVSPLTSTHRTRL